LSDRFFQEKSTEAVDHRIVLVGITEADIAKLQVNRLSDWYLYNLIEKIEAGKPVAVGLDIFRDHPVPPSYQELQQLQQQGIDVFAESGLPWGNRQFLGLFKKYPNLYGIGLFQGKPNDPDFAAISPPQIPTAQITGGGTPIDGDYVKRRSYLWDVVGGQGVPNLAFALAQHYLEAKGLTWKPYQEKIWRDYGKVLKRFGLRESFFGEPGLVYHIGDRSVLFRYFSGWEGPYVGEAAGGFQILNNWRRANFEFYSVTDVMTGKVSSEVFGDRLVLIGAYAPSLKDMLPTPLNSDYRRMHGIEIIAQTTSQIIAAVLDGRSLITPWREPGISLWLLGLGMSIFQIVRRCPSKYWWLGIIFLGFLSNLLWRLGYFYFLRGVWLPIIPSLITCWFLGVAALVWGYEVTRRRDYNIIKNSLGKQQVYQDLAVFSQENVVSLLNSLQYLYSYNDYTKKMEERLMEQISKVKDQQVRVQLVQQLTKITIPLEGYQERLDQLCLFLVRLLPESKNLLSLELRNTPIPLRSQEYITNFIKETRDFFQADYGIKIEEVVRIKLEENFSIDRTSSNYLTATLFRILNDILFYFYAREVIDFSVFICGELQADRYEISLEALQGYTPKQLVLMLCQQEATKWGGEVVYTEGKWKVRFLVTKIRNGEWKRYKSNFRLD
jgi:CHASE2 domain-containing sensor protein